MQPGSFDNTNLHLRVDILPRARYRAYSKARSVAEQKNDSASNGHKVFESCDPDISADISVVETHEEVQSSLHLYIPRRRAVSPYQPHTERANVRLQELIHHYTTVVATLTVTPVGPRHEWFPSAAIDEALFHAVMSHTAAHSAYLRKVPLQNETDYFWHTGQAIRLVNARLGEGIDKAATDATICAVCCLTQQQAFAGQTTNTQVHLNGLIQLVHAAGGLQSINLKLKTQRFILLTDLATSITLQKNFYLEPILKSPHLCLYFGNPSPATALYARTLGARLFNYSDSSPLSQRAHDLFWGLRNLSILLEDIRAGRASPDTDHAEDLQFTDRVEILERLAHTLWYHESCNPPTTPTFNLPSNTTLLTALPPPINPIFPLLGHAALIYIYTYLRQLPRELGMLKLVAGRIVTILEHMYGIQQSELLATFKDLMVWVMFLGGSVAAPREKIVLARLVTRVLIVAGCEEESEVVEATGGGFLWPELRVG